jgi:subtilisin family serine protease
MNMMTPSDSVTLTPLMQLTSGRADVRIGLIDGPVAKSHPELANEHVREIADTGGSAGAHASGAACLHGTFVAGILSAKRESVAPAICPDCTLLVRPIFAEATAASGSMPSATSEELAQAVLDCIAAGARVLNVSAALAQPSVKQEQVLEEALDQAARRGVLVIVAAGNQGILGSTAITRHPWVIPVVAHDHKGRLLDLSNLGSSIGRRGLGAPGDRITSLGADGKVRTSGGTSAAAPFVTGAIALLWSVFPQATTFHMKLAVTRAYSRRRPTVTPPLLDAWAAYQYLLTAYAGRT